MKRYLVIALALMMVFATIGIAQAEGKSFTLNYNVLENDQHPQGLTMAAFKDKVEELSDGQIKVNIYYSGALYGQNEMVEAMMNGSLDMSQIAFQDIAPYVPAADMFAAPFTFVSYAHMDAVFAEDSQVRSDFFAMVSDGCGFTPIGFMTQGGRNILTRAAEPAIVTPEDLKGVRLRMPDAPSWISAGESLGAEVVPVAYSELYTALQNGTVDACENGLAAIKTANFYEVTKQISITNHIIDIKLICVTNDVWAEMTDEQKGWMLEAAAYAGQVGNQATYDAEAVNITFFQEQGMTITQPDINAFKQYSHDYYVEKGLTNNWNTDLYDAVVALIP